MLSTAILFQSVTASACAIAGAARPTAAATVAAAAIRRFLISLPFRSRSPRRPERARGSRAPRPGRRPGSMERRSRRSRSRPRGRRSCGRSGRASPLASAPRRPKTPVASARRNRRRRCGKERSRRGSSAHRRSYGGGDLAVRAALGDERGDALLRRGETLVAAAAADPAELGASLVGPALGADRRERGDGAIDRVTRDPLLARAPQHDAESEQRAGVTEGVASRLVAFGRFLEK